MSSMFPTYTRFDMAIESAKGMEVFDTSGKKYIDFTSGIGGCNLGHRHPYVQTQIEDQLNKYWHISNLYYNTIQDNVAKALTDKRSLNLVIYANRGAEG